MLRVGRTRYEKGRVFTPSFPDFKQIMVLTKGYYKDLCPYFLTNNDGQILENVWQFSKVYKTVPNITVPYSSGNSTIVWEWPEETHVMTKNDKDELTDEYWHWRNTGMNHTQPVRMPVGWKHAKNCLYAYHQGEKLNYIEARKAIYFPIYKEAVEKHPKFWELVQLLKDGINLLIIEVDGPHQESLDYYKEQYNVENDFIENHTVIINENNLNILLNDVKHPFGHGYCLASCLMSATI